MKFFALAVTAASLFFASLSAQADESCDKFKTSYDRTYCVAKLFLESDKELNAAYTELRKPLKDSVKQQLTETQRDWIKHRDAACEQSGAINVGCNFKINKERTDYLRDRVRECKAGNCQDQAIAKKSW